MLILHLLWMNAFVRMFYVCMSCVHTYMLYVYAYENLWVCAFVYMCACRTFMCMSCVCGHMYVCRAFVRSWMMYVHVCRVFIHVSCSFMRMRMRMYVLVYVCACVCEHVAHSCICRALVGMPCVNAYLYTNNISPNKSLWIICKQMTTWYNSTAIIEVVIYIGTSWLKC